MPPLGTFAQLSSFLKAPGIEWQIKKGVLQGDQIGPL